MTARPRGWLGEVTYFTRCDVTGGVLVLSATFNPWQMSVSDREFVFAMADAVRDRNALTEARTGLATLMRRRVEALAANPDLPQTGMDAPEPPEVGA